MSEQEASIDFGYTRELLDRINTMSYGGAPLINNFYYDGYNLWQAHQELIVRDIKEFSKTKVAKPRPKRKLRVRIQEIIVYIFFGIVSLLAWASVLLRRSTILVYGVNTTKGIHKGDFRLDQLYRVLHGEAVSYCEVLHSLCRLESVKDTFVRRRFTLGIEVLEGVYALLRALGGIREPWVFEVKKLDLSSCKTEDEKKFVIRIACSYIRRSSMLAWQMQLCAALLERTRIRAVYMLDDMRHAYPIIYAARKHRIPCIALQHGHFTRYHFGWLTGKGARGPFLAPSKLLVWSDFWKQSLLKHGTYFASEEIVVAGNKTPVPELKEKDQSDTLTIVVPYETIAPKHEVTEVIQQLLECENTEMLFKIRPDMSEEKQLCEYGLEPHEKLEVITDHTPYLAEIDMVMGVYSTYLYDLLAYGKRAIIIDTSSVYGRDMVEDGVADLLSREKVCEKVKALAGRPFNEVKERQQKVFAVPENKLLEDTLRESIEKYVSKI